MTNKVKCTVDNCHYWENDLCTADTIEVAKNITGNNDMEAGTFGKNLAHSSQTQCTTFKPKQ